MRLLFFITFLLSVFHIKAQVNSTETEDDINITPKDDLMSELANECFHSNGYNRVQRLAMYPFNKANSIKIISFNTANDITFIPVKKHIVDYSRVKESQTLGVDKRDELTDILYNIGFTPDINPRFKFIGEYKCYEPRNGILFLDQRGKAFEFIEICFACQKTRTSSRRVKEGTYCNQKFELLNDFFRRAGIKYGISIAQVLTYSEILKLDTDTAALLSALRAKLDRKIIGDNLDRLTAIEKNLFFLLNASNIYRSGRFNSGIENFYVEHSGAFHSETIAILAEIGSVHTLSALQAAVLQWPGSNVPKDIMVRRKKMIEMANKAVSAWQDIEYTLYIREDVVLPGENTVSHSELTKKEDLDGLIINYIMKHKDFLKNLDKSD